MIKGFILVVLLVVGAVYGFGGGPAAVKQALVGSGQSSADFATGASYTSA